MYKVVNHHHDPLEIGDHVCMVGHTEESARGTIIFISEAEDDHLPIVRIRFDDGIIDEFSTSYVPGTGDYACDDVEPA